MEKKCNKKGQILAGKLGFFIFSPTFGMICENIEAPQEF